MKQAWKSGRRCARKDWATARLCNFGTEGLVKSGCPLLRQNISWTSTLKDLSLWVLYSDWELLKISMVFMHRHFKNVLRHLDNELTHLENVLRYLENVLRFRKCMQYIRNPCTFQLSKLWLASECLKMIGCLTKFVGNVYIAAPQIFPFLMSRGVLSFGVIKNPNFTTANIKGARNISHTIPQDIWMNERMNQCMIGWCWIRWSDSQTKYSQTNEVVWVTINK